MILASASESAEVVRYIVRYPGSSVGQLSCLTIRVFWASAVPVMRCSRSSQDWWPCVLRPIPNEEW